MKLDPKLAILLIEHDMDVVFDVAVSNFRAAFRRNSGDRHAGTNSFKRASVQEIYLGTD